MAYKNLLPSQVSPEAAMLASRLDALHADGHTWMDPLLQVHLAQNGGSNDAMLNTAGLYKNVLKQNGTAPSLQFADGALNQVPTSLQKAFAGLHISHGANPILTDDVTGIQKNLQAKGYGKDLTVGAWNSEWNYVSNQHLVATAKKPGLGNVQSLPFWKAAIGEIAPSHWTSTIVHSAASILHTMGNDVRQGFADVAGEIGNYNDPKNFIDLINPWVSDAEASAFNQRTAERTAKFEQALGGKVKASDLTPAEMNARSAKDLGNLLNAILLKGAGKALYSGVGAVGKAYVESLASEEGAGKVFSAAKNLVTRSLPEEFAHNPRYTLVNLAYKSGLEDKAGSGLLRSLENMPVLKRMLPAIDLSNPLTLNGSRYIYFKNALAQTARIPLKALGAQFQSKGMLAGLGLLGTSAAEKGLGAEPTIDATKVAPYGGLLGNAMDTAGMFVGSPTRGLSTSQNVGKLFSDTHATLSQAAGSIGIDDILRKSIGISLKSMQKVLGQDFVNDHIINTKINQFSASHYAEKKLAEAVKEQGIDKFSPEGIKMFKDFEHEALAPENATLLAKERESLILQPGVLGNYYRNEFINSPLNRKVRAGIGEGEFYDISAKDKSRWFDAMKKEKEVQKHMTVLMHPDIRNNVHGSATIADVEDIKTRGLEGDWAQGAPTFDETFGPWGGSPRLFHVSPGVNEVAPASSKLAKSTPYGFGVSATDNTSLAGRAKANIYSVTHAPAGAEAPKFYDMTKLGNSSIISEKIRSLLGGTYDAPAGALANSTIRQYRDELGLMQPGKTSGTLVPIPKSEYSKAYLEFRKVATNPFDYSAQQVIDAYRKALVVGGKMSVKQIDARIADITNATMEDYGYTGFIYRDAKLGMQHIINPERVKANMYIQDPKWSTDSLLSNYLQNNNVVERGALGRAGKDKFVAQDAQREAARLFQKLTDLGHGDSVDAARSTLQLEEKANLANQKLPSFAGTLNEGERTVLAQARGILVNKLGLNSNQVTDLDPIEAISLIWRQSKNLASEAYLPLDAPQHAKDAVAALDRLGVRLVLGRDIGHSFEAPLLEPVIIQQRTNLLRRAMLRTGLDITEHPDIVPVQLQRMNEETAINKLIASGKISPAFGDNGNAIVSYLMQVARSGEAIKEGWSEGVLRGAVQKIALRKTDRFVDQMLGDTSKMTYEEIQTARQAARAKVIEEFNANHTLRDMSQSQIIEALSGRPLDPKDVLPKLDASGAIEGRYKKEDAVQIARAILIGRASTSTSIVGLSGVENYIRASGAMLTNNTMSFLGQAPLLNKFKVGNGWLANHFASMPDDLARLRDKWRFELSPVFSYRRLFKTNVKAATEGIEPTANPYNSLYKMGKVDEAFSILEKTMPEVFKAGKELEPFDKFLQQSDVFGIYNPRHAMAWQAYNLKKLGLSDAEITDKLIKINSYGDRTPLERTVNTFFYPFSFNKTLYRNVGGWLLDNSSQAMLIGAAFALYQHYDPNNDLGKWVDKHLPLLNEAKKLNAFEHGTGLGQYGGINAPYLSLIANIFSPQQIKPINAVDAYKTWSAMIPALQELNTVLFGVNSTTGKFQLGSAPESAMSAFWYTKNLVQHGVDMVTGQKSVDHTTLTSKAQIDAGINFVASLKISLAPILSNPNAVWPTNPDIPKQMWGDKVTVSSLRKLANIMYPAFDPNMAATLAMAKNTEADKYVSNLKGSWRYDGYSKFQAIAKKAIAVINKSDNPVAIEAAAKPLRTISVLLAEQDPKFAAFYRKYYASTLGPIEGLNK